MPPKPPPQKPPEPLPTADEAAAGSIAWSPEAAARLARVPEGFMREMTKKRVETFARKTGAETVTKDLMEKKYAAWAEGSAKRQSGMDWDTEASARIERIPDFIRPMVVLEIERCAREMGLDMVTGAAIDKAREAWEGFGAFHSEGTPGQYKN